MASLFFDLSPTKILILGLLGLLIFGPDQLPRMAAQAGKALRDLRRFAMNAKADLTDGLGPEFSNFDINDLNPKAFVRKHLLDDIADDDDFRWNDPAPDVRVPAIGAPYLAPGEIPPFDSEAT